MSSTQDPEELVVCPYDPVHRVAAKKLPYHISKCRKQYDKSGEYKTCPFNARHVIPDPEFLYHMETCDSKGAVDMEIAFEQSKNEISHTVKGCTDIPPPSWSVPKETENWDDEDDAPPVLQPKPIRFLPPANLPRPTASRPISRFDATNSPMSRQRSPNMMHSGGLMASPRGGRNSSSPRASRGRHLPSYGFGDEQFLSTARPRSTPSPDNESFAREDSSVPLSQDQPYFCTIPSRDENARSTSSSGTHEMFRPSSIPQTLPEQQTNDHPLQIDNQSDYVTPQPYNPHLPQSFLPSNEPLVSYQTPLQLYPPQPQPQPVQYSAPPMSLPTPPQATQPYLPQIMPSQQYIYNTQVPQLHYMPPTNPAQPTTNPYLPQQQQQQLLPPQPPYQTSQPPYQAPYQTSQPPYQTPQSPYQTTQPPYQTPQPPYQTSQPPYQTTQLPPSSVQPYPPIQSFNSNPYQYQYAPSACGSQSSIQRAPGPGLSSGTSPGYAPMYTQPISTLVTQGNMYPPSCVSYPNDQSSVVTPGGSSPGRGRGRGLPNASQQYYPPTQQDLYPHTNQQQLFQPPVQYNTVAPNPPAAPVQQVPPTQHFQQAAQGPAPFSQQPNSNPHPSLLQPSVTEQSNLGNAVMSHFPIPKPGGAPLATKLNRVKVSLARITLIEHKRDSGTPLSREEEELVASKSSLIEQLK